MFGSTYRRRSQRSYRPPVHQTRGARFNRTQARNMRQNSRRQSVYGRNRNRNRNSRNRNSRNRNSRNRNSIFSGGFFEKFASELKQLTK